MTREICGRTSNAGENRCRSPFGPHGQGALGLLDGWISGNASRPGGAQEDAGTRQDSGRRIEGSREQPRTIRPTGIRTADLLLRYLDEYVSEDPLVAQMAGNRV